MDELITVKEEKIQRLEDHNDKLSKKIKYADEESQRSRILEDKFK